MARRIDSFGRASPPSRRAMVPGAAIALLKGGQARAASLAAYGNGRSYGDSCLTATGTLIEMRGMRRILDFDPETGLLTAEAGVMLSAIIDRVIPHGWFPAVVPGTRHVTLGGAIANDIHGKNHHRRGTFGTHVEALTLLRSTGRLRELRPDDPLFEATVGGLGLTGLILSATIRLMRVASPDVMEKVTPFSAIDGYFDLADAADRDNEYAVAWIDQLAEGGAAGRGLMITGNHTQGERALQRRKLPLTVPFQPPVNILSRPFLRVFNALYAAGKSRAGAARPAGYESFFFPLDGVSNWNRLYGPRGLLQHQSVVPLASAREAIPQMLAATRAAGQASFLTVLKRFGAQSAAGIMSFPREGHTLTLDFPHRGRATLELLDRLDRIAIAAGGAVNAYKDARMPAATFAASYPRWGELEEMRDPAFMTDFWRRTAMTLRRPEQRLAAE